MQQAPRRNLIASGAALTTGPLNPQYGGSGRWEKVQREPEVDDERSHTRRPHDGSSVGPPMTDQAGRRLGHRSTLAHGPGISNAAFTVRGPAYVAPFGRGPLWSRALRAQKLSTQAIGIMGRSRVRGSIAVGFNQLAALSPWPDNPLGYAKTGFAVAPVSDWARVGA